MALFNTDKRISRHLTWQSHARIDTGNVRKINEDRKMVNDSQAHWAVADGMGGHERGDVASEAVCEALAELKQRNSLGDLLQDIEDALVEVNNDLIQQMADSDAVMGTTVAGLVLRENTALIYWLGDSRIYRLRKGVMEQLSIDHTIVNELVKTKRIYRQDIHSHPEKNVITHAIGAESDCILFSEVYPVEHGDVFFICTDGVEKELKDEEVRNLIVRNQFDMEYAADALLKQIIDRGARDNVAFVLVAISSIDGS